MMNFQHNMHKSHKSGIFCIFCICICIITVALISNVQAISMTPTTFTLEILFDEPKSKTSSFSESYSVQVTNDANFSVTLNATGVGCGNIVVSMSPVTLSKNTTETIGIDFEVPSSQPEGKYTCKANVFGNNFFTVSLTATINVIYPPPQLWVKWDNDIRKAKAGEKYSRNIIIEEIMGYKPAKYVTVEIKPLEEEKPIFLDIKDEKGQSPPFYFKQIDAGKSDSKQIIIAVPERNLVPGNYTLNTRTKATNNKPEDNVDYLFMYEVPYPVMRISENIDFESLTFSEGKNTLEKSLRIEEIGEYTPIEGIAIEKISGEDGWITLPAIDYVKPNSSENFTFKISLPEDAKLGKREWKFKIRTIYAGSNEFSTNTLVYFPSLDESIAEAKNMPKSEISENLILMLEGAKTSTEKQNLKDLAGTMYIFSASKTLIFEISAMKNTDALGEKLSHISAIKRSINKIEMAKKLITAGELLDKATKILNYARNIEKSEIDAEVENIRKNLEIYKKEDYKRCAVLSKKIGEIYGQELPEQKICEEKYIQAITKASKLKDDAENVRNEIEENTFVVGTGRILLNPFAYDYVITKYDENEKIYENLIKFYDAAGETGEAKIYEKKSDDLKTEKNIVSAFFMVYGAIVILILTSIVVRIFIGWTQYKRDEEEKMLGDVVYG
ncbi:MAG: hypothetical protein COY41_04530 [Candidatus Altarchaeum sp. CG_4_10_14_0_8_um_filter_32_851]|nr:MAG: hypothetical protein COY41_04530 [Candidatus Altarchaeum sp. CG_4_10_14_0_8_um_filter_32_851]